MKGFKFKLEAVLKVRKLKEEQCKMQIGRIQLRLRQLQSFLDEHSAGIESSYKAQEEALSSGLNGKEIQFHPYFVSGKKAHMKQIEKEMKNLEEEVKEKYKELAKLKAETNVIDEMKEKQKTQYKKNLEKKQFAEIEEQVQNWKQIIK